MKKRLDQLLVEQGHAVSRSRGRALIMAGKVLVNGHTVTKPGTPIAAGAGITVKMPDHPFVSRGGVKLQKALRAFDIDVKNRTCLDVGASTGGFTDCLLFFGARLVYAVDVGYGQLAWKLRQDNRVIVLERTNIRKMDSGKITAPVDVAVIDVSFISLRIVVPATAKFVKKGGTILALVKPQFEVGKKNVGKGGIVRDADLHKRVLDELRGTFLQMGLACSRAVPSPISGSKGNREFLICLGVTATPLQPVDGR